MLATFFSEIHHYVGDYGYLAVGLGILLEDFGLPTPGETLLITGAVLASGGALNIWWLLLVAWTAAVVGDNIGFYIGRTGGHAFLLRFGKRFGITQARLDKVEGMFHRYGVAVIMLARFVVILRQLNGIVAGSLRLHWLRFLIANAIGAALWVGFWGHLAYWLGRRVYVYAHAIEHIEPLAIGGAAVAAFIAGIYVYRWRHERRDRNGKR